MSDLQTNNESNRRALPSSYTNDQIDRLIENQAKGLEISNQKMILETERIKTSKEIASEAIRFQKEDNTEERAHERHLMNWTFSIVVLVIVAFIFIVVMAFQYGLKEQIIEACKYLFTAILSGLAGWFGRASKIRRDEKKESSTNYEGLIN